MSLLAFFLSFAFSFSYYENISLKSFMASTIKLSSLFLSYVREGKSVRTVFTSFESLYIEAFCLVLFSIFDFDSGGLSNIQSFSSINCFFVLYFVFSPSLFGLPEGNKFTNYSIGFTSLKTSSRLSAVNTALSPSKTGWAAAAHQVASTSTLN